MADALQGLGEPVRQLIHLNSLLGDSPVKLAKESDLITTVYNRVVRNAPNPHEWPIFNRFLEILFGHDV